MPILSICIVSYKVRDVLEKCLNSIYGNTKKMGFEVIVVDNNSGDGTWELVKDGFPDVRLVVNMQNLGFARAANMAIQASKGRYLLLLNPDTEILENSLENMVKYLDNNERIGILGGRVLNPDGTQMLSCSSFPSLLNYSLEAFFLYRLFPRSRFFGRPYLSYLDYDKPQDVDVVLGAFFMIRKKALEEVGNFDERFFLYSEETDLCLRVKKAGWKVYYTPDAKVLHWGGESTKTAKARTRTELLRSKRLFFEKHYGSSKSRAASHILALGALLRLITWLPMFGVLSLTQKNRNNHWEKVLHPLVTLKWFVRECLD